jgi:hypothetical protein
MLDTTGVTGSSANSLGAERVFVDADGARWRVFEQPFAEYDRRRGLSLIFASDAAVRRVRNYPADWAEISDVELAALSWKS